jgi:DNA-directed RNA polymerase specialized sigma subunit
VILGIEARAYHASIRNARHDRGLTQREVEKMAGVPVGLVCRLETLRLPRLTEDARRVLTVLALDPETYPDWLGGLELHGTKRIERSVTAELMAPARLRELGSGTYDDDAEIQTNLRKDVLRKALDSLPERERRILEMRFGLKGDPAVLEEVAHKLNITCKRVLQLEEQALKRLRNLSDLEAI